jgi:hypothetical protein
MPLHENLIFSSVISDAQYIFLHHEIILSLSNGLINFLGSLLQIKIGFHIIFWNI